MKLDGKGQAATETLRYNKWCLRATGTATWALMWSDGWEIKREGEVEKSRRDVWLMQVVNQEANGGEPKQMLTGCLVNRVFAALEDRKKTRQNSKRKAEFDVDKFSS